LRIGAVLLAATGTAPALDSRCFTLMTGSSSIAS
jgi:hypothetical protein